MKSQILPVSMGVIGLALMLMLAATAQAAEPSGLSPSSDGSSASPSDLSSVGAANGGCILAAVTGVVADRLGNTWFSTWNGIAVHTADGQWACFTPGNSGLAHVYCWDIAVDSRGRVWVTHYVEHGVSLLDPNGTPANLADDTWLVFTAAERPPRKPLDPGRRDRAFRISLVRPRRGHQRPHAQRHAVQ